MTLDFYCFKENELYGSELPKTQEDLDYIKKQGIKVIISLEETINELAEHSTLKTDFEHIELYITDYGVPQTEQIEKFLEVFSKAKEEKKSVLVHCYAGCGRTGVMLALAEKLFYTAKDGEEAIKNLKKVRSCALETSEQRAFVINYKWKKLG